VIVCSCNAVTDRAVRAAIVTGDETPEQIAQRSGAGADCGGCRNAIADLLDEAATPVDFPVAS
jgi:bacterioferritin-associated ferredoxin